MFFRSVQWSHTQAATQVSNRRPATSPHRSSHASYTWLCEDVRQATATLLVNASLTFHSPKRDKESRQTFLGAQGLNFNRRDLRDLLHRVGGATRSERKPWQKLFRFGLPKGLCCHLVRAFDVSLRTQVRCSRKQPRSAACMSKGDACSV